MASKFCNDLVSDPAARQAYLQSIRPRYRGLVGTLSNYIPEEIIAAAGFHPVRLIGRFAGGKGQGLFTPVCSLARDAFAAACAGEFDLLTEVIFPNSCDSLRVLYQAWCHRLTAPSAWHLCHPVSADEAAVTYFADQLRALAAHLQDLSGSPLTDGSLRAAIEQYNQTRRLLRELSRLRITRPGGLKGSEALALATAGLLMDRDEYAARLRQTLETVQQGTAAENKGRRLLLSGPLMDSIPLVECIEQFGGQVVYEDITNGARWADRDVETEGDSYINLARRYLRAAPSPTRHSLSGEDQNTFESLLEQVNPDGILYINQKFCEPHVHRFLHRKEIAKAKGVPMLLLEIEHGKETVDQRGQLRIESFLETIKRSE